MLAAKPMSAWHRRLTRAWLAPAWLAVVVLLAAVGSAAAQEASAPPPPEASADELQALIDTLENDAERQAFVERLRTLMEAKRAEPATADPSAARSLGSELLAALSERMTRVTRQLDQAGAALAALPSAAMAAAQSLTDPTVRTQWGRIVAQIVAVVAAGLLAEWVATRILARPRARVAPETAPALPLRTLLVLGRAVLDAVPVAALAAAGWGVIAAWGFDSQVSLVAVLLINAAVLSRVVALVGRAVLAPRTPALRLPRIADTAADYLYGWLRRLAFVAIYGFFTIEALRALGVAPGTAAVLTKALGLAVALLVIAFILQNRQRVAAWLSGARAAEGQVATLRRRLADLWHLLAIVYVLAAYAVWALGIQGGFPFLLRATVLTLLIGLLARAVHHALSRLYDRGLAFAPALQRDYPGLEGRLNRYIPVLRQITDVLALIAAALLILRAWQIDVIGWFSTGVGQQLVSTLLSVALVVVLALIVWETVASVLDRLHRRAMRDGAAAKRSARVQTLLPLLRNAFRIVLITIATLIGLSEIGVDIGPLLAGAGVIGLAIGFGSQSLVKDVITGVFLLAEDSMAIGDWVEAGGHSGEVENLTIRTMTLRDLSGQVHVVPFSDITSIINMSRDYGQAVIDVAVAYREDTDAVTGLLEQVAREMRDDPHWGPRILDELEVFGVNDLGESAVTIRVRLKTGVLMHWGVRREFLRRTKKLFDARGVEIPYPHRTLYFGEAKDGTAPPARVAMRRPPRESDDRAEAPEPTQTSGPQPDEAG